MRFYSNNSGAVSFQGTGNFGTSGQVLTSNGNSAYPSWQTGGSGVSAFQTATGPSGQVSMNFGSGTNWLYTLSANTLFNNPTGTSSGQNGSIVLTQSASTGYTVSWGPYWYFGTGAAYTGNSSLNSTDVLNYVVVSDTKIVATNITRTITAFTGASTGSTGSTGPYSIRSIPCVGTSGDTLNVQLTSTGVSAGTSVYWQMTGVSASLFNPATMTGTATITSTGSGLVPLTLANPLSASTGANFDIKFYSDVAKTTQIGNTSGGFINSGITRSTPKLGAYIDLYQYRNTGGVYPDGSYTGLNPVMRASNINTILPTLDKFYMFGECQIYSDGYLYMGSNVGVAAAKVLNTAGTGWATNTGNTYGGYVDPTNPDYTYSAYALKNSMYYLTQQSAWSSNNTMMCIGGYMLSNYMDQAGANDTLAQIAANQIANLMNICGCVGVDLDYEPVGQVCVPANMARICQKTQTAVKAINASYEVHLTLVPALSVADAQLRIATAVACAPYVDQINIMTYDDPNTLYQPQYGSADVFNHTGVPRSVQSVQWFINAGVPYNKLGIGFACYGRNSASESSAFTNNGAVYDQVVRTADAAGQTSNDFEFGTFSGSVPIINPAPTDQSNYYYNPTNAVWAFDSVGTVSQKVQAAHNMGLRSVFCWQISNDYSNPGSLTPAGNARANYALIKAARAAITNLPV